MKYGKIVSGELVLVDPTKAELTEEGIYTRVPKTAQELDGAKPVVYGEYPAATVYDDVTTTYDDSGSTLVVSHQAVRKPNEDVIVINQSFWDTNYRHITTITDRELYSPVTSIKDGEQFDTLKNDYAILLKGASAGLVDGFELEVYEKPDFTQDLTSVYIESLKLLVSDMDDVGKIMMFYDNLYLGARTGPSLV